MKREKGEKQILEISSPTPSELMREYRLKTQKRKRMEGKFYVDDNFPVDVKIEEQRIIYNVKFQFPQVAQEDKEEEEE